MAGEKLYSFTVEGRGLFPTDMLRYDHCWPHAEQSDSPEILAAPLRAEDPEVSRNARKIIQAMGNNPDLMREILRQLLDDHESRLWDKPRKVTLVGHYAPNEGRWQSFGWKVVGPLKEL